MTLRDHLGPRTPENAALHDEMDRLLAARAVALREAEKLAFNFGAKAFWERYEVDYHGRKRWDQAQLRRAENKCMNILSEDIAGEIAALATADSTEALRRVIRAAEEAVLLRVLEEITVRRKEASSKADGVVFQALDDLRWAIRAFLPGDPFGLVKPAAEALERP